MTQQRNGRRGANFTVRVTDEERQKLETEQARGEGPRSLGPWIVWRALGRSTEAVPPPAPGSAVPALRANVVDEALPDRAPRPGSARAAALPISGAGTARSATSSRIILDLCGGTGSWSRPYAEAGYDVRIVTLPEIDVRTYVPPERVHGVLAAPPCTEFSTARRDDLRSCARDFILGMETVNACMRIILQTRPTWWAIENPTGHLAKFLGTPRDVFQPADFGDPWTKQTALWGDFAIPERGPFVEPLGNGPFCSLCDPERKRRSWCANAAHRAITPAGFARAFFRANP